MHLLVPLWKLHIVHFRLPQKPWAIFAWLLVMYLCHIVAMVMLEDMSWSDADWLSWTTIFTVGYGDLSAKTFWGRQATKLFMYIGGVFALASAANLLIEKKAEMTALKLAGKWRWRLDNHILIVSPLGKETDEYYHRMVKEIRKVSGWEKTCIQILSPCFDHLPDILKAEGVVHYKGRGSQVELEACDVEKSRAVLVLGYNTPESDALVFDIISRIPKHVFVVAECVDDKSRNRFRSVGADVVMRPLRGYPEMVARGLTAPGSEQIMEEMFSGHGKVVRRIDLGGMVDIDLPHTVIALCERELGTLVATSNGFINVAPTGKSVNADALFVLVDEQVQDIDVIAAVARRS